jgi:hypothetical protein
MRKNIIVLARHCANKINIDRISFRFATKESYGKKPLQKREKNFVIAFSYSCIQLYRNQSIGELPIKIRLINYSILFYSRDFYPMLLGKTIGVIVIFLLTILCLLCSRGGNL